MSGISSLFSNFRSLNSRIVLVDGSFKPVLGTGDINPTSSLSLSSGLFVPQFPFNLLSVSQLTKSLHCSITFSPSSCVFQDLRTKKVIGSGHERNGLYYLDLGVSHTALSTTVSPLQWHYYQLGHPSLQILRHALPELGPTSRLDCEAC